MKAIINGTVITPFETIQDGVIVTDGAQIQAVGPRRSTLIPPEAETINAGGKSVLPGLIDIHMYGNLGVSITSPERVAEELPALARNVARFGVTRFLISPTLGERGFNTRLMAAFAEMIPKVRGGAQPLGIHLEGPWLDPEQRGAFPKELLHPPSIEEAREYFTAAHGYLRVVTLAPNFPESRETARWLTEQGVRASLGHSNTTFEIAHEALRSGFFPLVTHVYNAMSGLHHRRPGVLGAVLSSDHVMGMLIADGIHAHPAAVKILLRTLGTEGVILVTDATPGAGLTEGTFPMLGQAAHVIDGVARLADGTIAGSILTMNRAVLNVQNFVGLSLNQAVAMATVNPARALGGWTQGQLTRGADADVIVMDNNGDVSLTIAAGEIVFAG